MTQNVPKPDPSAGFDSQWPVPAAALRSRIERAPRYEVIGSVAAVTGSAIEVRGMTAPLGAICKLTTSRGRAVDAQVVGFRDAAPILTLLDPMPAVSAGDEVRLVAYELSVPGGPGLLGRVIDPLGRPLDGRPLDGRPLTSGAAMTGTGGCRGATGTGAGSDAGAEGTGAGIVRVPIERDPPASLERPMIDQAMSTGVKAIDTLLTCGHGQRLGIFAGSGVGKSTLLGMLARGSQADRIVIGLVGERGREVQEFIDRCLGPEGLARSVVVVATSDRPASQRVAAASAATAIAESFRDAGENVLLLIDSVTRYAMALREIGLAAGQAPTTRGYPADVFARLPVLVERTGRTRQGSITAFYSVLVEGDDPNEPIADTLRGLLDGHIVLNRSLSTGGHFPPIDPLESLSRLQPHVVSQAAMNAAIAARRELATYRKNEDLISIGAYRAGTDPGIDRAIAMQASIMQFLQQDAGQLQTLEQSQQMLAQITSAAAPIPPVAS